MRRTTFSTLVLAPVAMAMLLAAAAYVRPGPATARAAAPAPAMVEPDTRGLDERLRAALTALEEEERWWIFIHYPQPYPPFRDMPWKKVLRQKAEFGAEFTALQMDIAMALEAGASREQKTRTLADADKKLPEIALLRREFTRDVLEKVYGVDTYPAFDKLYKQGE